MAPPLDGETVESQAEPVDIGALLRIETGQGTGADVLQERFVPFISSEAEGASLSLQSHYSCGLPTPFAADQSFQEERSSEASRVNLSPGGSIVITTPVLPGRWLAVPMFRIAQVHGSVQFLRSGEYDKGRLKLAVTDYSIAAGKS